LHAAIADAARRAPGPGRLGPPPVRADLVARPRQIDRLTRLSSRKLTLLAAPTGYGKTTLLSSWAAGETRPVAWLTFGPDDGDPVRLWSLVGRALASASPGLEGCTELFSGRRLVLLERAVPLLLNTLAGLPEQIVLVLDDYHAVSSGPCNESVAFFLE